MDTRVTSETGEHPIYPFCDDGAIEEQDLMPEVPIAPDGIEPFGSWLERHVHQLIGTLRVRLPYVNALTGAPRQQEDRDPPR